MGSRRRIIVVMLVATALGSIGLGMSAYGAGFPSVRVAGEPTPTSVQIAGNYAFSRAVITGPGLAQPRVLNAYQAAVFVQSWLGDTVFGTPVRESPPPDVPVFRVDVTGFWGGNTATLAVYYAADKTNVWIAFPRQPTSTSTPSTRPPSASGWFLALPRVRQAFAGTARLVPTAGIAQPSTSTSAPAGAGLSPTTLASAAPAHKSSGGGTSALAPLGVAIAALVGVGAGLLIRRGRGRAGSKL